MEKKKKIEEEIEIKEDMKNEEENFLMEDSPEQRIVKFDKKKCICVSITLPVTFLVIAATTCLCLFLFHDECQYIDSCAANANCRNIIASYACKCLPGYTGDPYHLCSDIDECAQVDTCGQHTLCQNSNGGYTCSCEAGYEGESNSREGCTDVNECQPHRCARNALCFDEVVNNFTCACPDGTIGDPYNRYGLCREQDCNIANGECEHICSVKLGQVYCSCPDGFQLMPDKISCEDVDECLTGINGCSDLCNNLNGSYSCSCHNTRANLEDSKTCVTESCDNNNGGCSQTCKQELDGVQCSCHHGFTLSSNRKTCEDMDECATSNGGCQDICMNFPGGHNCSCSPGMILIHNDTSCTDIDECLESNGGCDHSCHNTRGSYRCNCKTGYKLVQGTQCRRCQRGMFSISNSNQCFKRIDEQIAWEDAQPRCEREGLRFASPADDIAVQLRKYILDTYGAGYYIWVNGRGDGRSQAWQWSKSAVNQSLLYPGAENEVSNDRCLSIYLTEDGLSRYPTRPYTTYFCTETRIVLCEEHM